MSESNTVDLPGHLKDAWLHVMQTTPAPSDEAFKEMADYLIKNAIPDIDDYYSEDGDSLRGAIDKALDVRDENGTPLRDYRVTYGQLKPFMELQEILFGALNK